jgi:uncharacterized protein (TIGR02231 family)
MPEEPRRYGSLESLHDAELVTAQLEADRGLSFTFRIPGKADIPSDGSPHKRTLTTFDLEPELDYLAIPKHTDAVFRRIKVENSPDAPLLPGKVNLFAEYEFIGSTEIEYIPTGGELELLFGVEERITVTRELKRRDVDKVLLRDRRQLRYGYEIEIDNLMPVPVQIELQDQYPVSRHEDIKVHLEKSEPKPSEVSELNILEWSISLEVGEKKSIIIGYGVDHPRGMAIVGLSRD